MMANSKLLSTRECQIISLIAEGHSYSNISQMLGISEATVKKNIRLMMRERGFTTPFQLITWAYHDAIIV